MVGLCKKDQVVSSCLKMEVRLDKAGSCISVNEEEFKVNSVKAD